MAIEVKIREAERQLDDPYLAPGDARPWIEKLPAATLPEIPGGHPPWFDDLAGSTAVITGHLAATGFPPQAAGWTHPAAEVPGGGTSTGVRQPDRRAAVR